MREIGQGFLRIVTNWRLLILILIITGFWMVQHQLYATMPKYVIRMAGETAKPGWIANVNPFVVVCCVSFVTRWMAKRSAITSMNIGMFLIPVSALLMACGNLLDNEVVSGMSNIKPASKRLIQSIVDSQNIIGNGYVARDYCAAYRMEFRSDENSIEQLLAGQLTVHTLFAPYIPAETIENIHEYDVSTLESVIGG